MLIYFGMERREDKVPESIYIYIFADVNSTVAVKEEQVKDKYTTFM